MKRQQYQNDALAEAPNSGGDEKAAAENDKAGNLRAVGSGGNLTSSLLYDNWHAPVIDLDFPCRLVPSRTKGHWHLYLDRVTDFDEMVEALDAMSKAGWVQRGFVAATRRRGASFVRTEGTFEPHSLEPM